MGRLLGVVLLIVLIVFIVLRRRAGATPKKPAAKRPAARVIEQPVRYVDSPAAPEAERPGSFGPPGT